MVFSEFKESRVKLQGPDRLPSAVLFDMDGTLTVPLLDFALIKREMGIGDQPILETLNTLPEPHRARATDVLLRHEEHAADNSTLNPGCIDLLEWLTGAGVGVAVVTRNSRRSVERVIRRHALALDVRVTRDDCAHKPDPAPLLLACNRLKVEPATAWMVGDGSHDVQAGAAANMRTVWISHGRSRDFPDHPWREVRDLFEVLALLQFAEGTKR